MSMDYEEKYKEALERARQFFEKPYLEDSAGIVGYIFPELKESEGEKIRKYLIKCVEENVFVKSFANNGFDKQTILAWLEKQSEQKHEWSEEDEEMIDSIIGNIQYLYSLGSCDNATVEMKVNWLKSLSPQNQWAPSKGQIMALRWVLNNVPYNKHKEEISGLLEQIKNFV